MKSTIKLLTIIAVFACLTACSSVGEKTVGFTYLISASEEINPDVNDKPSSVVLRIFQLSNRINFDNATYEELFDSTANVLGTELLGVHEYLIDPDSQKELDVEISENTAFIGVAVGYRSTDSVTWKAISPAPKKSWFFSNGVEVKISRLSVRLAEI